MNKTEKEARRWAEYYLNSPDWYVPGVEFFELCSGARAAAELVLANTEQITMADVEWDDEQHSMSGATSQDGTDVVMLWRDDLDRDEIICDNGAWQPWQLVQNGKRYKLVEVGATVSHNEKVALHQQDHPEFLETYEDFRNAPMGTIVARYSMAPWWKTEDDTWECSCHEASDAFMASKLHTLKVLRWGDEA